MWTITQDDAGLSVQAYLRKKHAFSRRLLRAIKDDGGSIKVNGCMHYLRYILQEGDMVAASFPPEKVAARLQVNAIPLTILYEDEVLMVIDKQAGLATIPSMNQPTHTLANGILAYYREQGIDSTVHVVTRLDKDTSGLVLIAKNRYSHALFARMQQSNEIKRKYTAIVSGHPIKQEGTIDAPIGRKDGSIIERQVTPTGKHAITDYNVRHMDASKKNTVVEVALQTGRTHQIRVHMAYIGHPLVGDDLYSEADVRMTRQALHCHQLTLKHPLTQEELTFHAPLPPDMEVLCQS